MIFQNNFKIVLILHTYAGVLSRIVQDKSADLINLKISKVGGLTKAKTIRDFAVHAGVPMNIEDTWFASNKLLYFYLIQFSYAGEETLLLLLSRI
jgi:hypothetical protein